MTEGELSMITFFKVSKVEPEGEYGLDGCIHLEDWFLLYQSDEPGLFNVRVVDAKTGKLNKGWNSAWCVRVGPNQQYKGEVVFSDDLHEFTLTYSTALKKWVGNIGPSPRAVELCPHHNGTWH